MRFAVGAVHLTTLSESQDEATPPPERTVERVLVTGATGFVGRYVLRELLRRGCTPVCLVRSRDRLTACTEELDRSRIASVVGSLFDRRAVLEAARQSHAVIHLVGIIMQNRWAGQTFDRVHRLGTDAVIGAAREAGIKRFIHMSALGARADAVSAYHSTKYAAEQDLRDSGLDTTVFQPSVIHGPDAEFMSLMKTMACSLIPPFMPYFGSGTSRLQPVSVKDVAHCMVEALWRDETIGRTILMGGPKTYSWKELYATCRRLIPGARAWKPMMSQPIPLAKLLARTVMKTPLVPRHLKFNVDQVQMSQEDSTCPTGPIESLFNIRLRDFESELARYADRIA